MVGRSHRRLFYHLLAAPLLRLAMSRTLISVEALRYESLQGERKRTRPSSCLCVWDLAAHPTWLRTRDLVLSEQRIKTKTSHHVNKPTNKLLEQLYLTQPVRVSFHCIRHLSRFREYPLRKERPRLTFALFISCLFTCNFPSSLLLFLSFGCLLHFVQFFGIRTLSMFLSLGPWSITEPPHMPSLPYHLGGRLPLEHGAHTRFLNPLLR
jgi:hypothetical protein